MSSISRRLLDEQLGSAMVGRLGGIASMRGKGRRELEETMLGEVELALQASGIGCSPSCAACARPTSRVPRCATPTSACAPWASARSPI